MRPIDLEEIANKIEGVAQGPGIWAATEPLNVGWFLLLLERTLERHARQLRAVPFAATRPDDVPALRPRMRRTRAG
jgi:hypothetical protein